ncbi:tatD family hydrolase [Colletotrichum tofieldiae]|uniref:TatD family hydrolase n=1 Tax=Colletotrichum tofieldiae TaxID=708197 RepID=A0A161WBK3_9PEZI|nr:TatD family hydrolase [Colletotrichum tofieldiae]GKT57216.1 TatD family hydrolase [Colletotrichum tofieldiae]GKT78947.1 tatD family hydrolase [Colletotrichum tofieldiae]GKT86767.1 tatD family hydrolase [Colletotrichum tofieldiae]
MTTPAESPKPAYQPRYIDIGINLADPIFRGLHHGKQRHPDDLDGVISRAKEVGCSKLIVTGSDFTSSRDALDIAKQYPGVVYTTIGIHPCSSAIFSSSDEVAEGVHTDPDPSKPIPDHHEPDPTKTEAIVTELRDLIKESAASKSGLVAFGEFGLDYDRLHYCSKTIQLHSFAAQLDLVLETKPQLPLFLHSRAAHEDFVRLLKEKFGGKLEKLEKGGVVHSFTGTIEEARELMDLGLYIGINGCSFKTEENCEVVKQIALDRMMIETDGPWCEIRPSHFGYKYLIEKKPETNGTADGAATPEPAQKPQGKKKNQKKEPEVPERFKVVKKEKWEEGAMIKGRNEPCMIERVAKAVAGIKGVEVEDICEAAWRNTVKVFAVDQ